MRARLVNLLKRPAVAGAASALFLRSLTLASRFLLSLLLARMLSPAEMGEYGLLTAVLAFALLVVGLEFYSYTLREMVTATPVRRARIIVDQIALGTAVLTALGVLMLAAIFTGLLSTRLAPWLLLILVTEHASLEATRILIITSRPIRGYVSVFLRGGIWVYAIAALMLAEPSTRTLETVLVFWAVGGVLSIAFSAISLSDLPWREMNGYNPDWTLILHGLRTARPFLLTATGALVISYVDRFVIDQFVGREALGIYTFYSTILIGLLSLGGAISHQFLPKVIAGYAAGANEYRAALQTFLWSMMALAAGTTVFCGLSMEPILRLLGLPAYESGILVFYAMLPATFLRMLADVPSYALYAARSDKSLLFCNLGSAAVSTLLNFLLVPQLGILGAALTGLIASAVLFLSLTILAIREMRRNFRKSTAVISDGFPVGPDTLYP